MALDIAGLGSIADFAGKVLDKIFPDPVARDAAKLELFKAQQAGELAELTAQWDNAKAQAAVNQVEAGSPSLFVSGWRPAVGWCCAAALMFQYIARPLIQWAGAISGHPLPPLPGIDDNLWQLMLGMLGLGGLRTFERVKGVAK